MYGFEPACGPTGGGDGDSDTGSGLQWTDFLDMDRAAAASDRRAEMPPPLPLPWSASGTSTESAGSCFGSGSFTEDSFSTWISFSAFSSDSIIVRCSKREALFVFPLSLVIELIYFYFSFFNFYFSDFPRIFRIYTIYYPKNSRNIDYFILNRINSYYPKYDCFTYAVFAFFIILFPSSGVHCQSIAINYAYVC